MHRKNSDVGPFLRGLLMGGLAGSAVVLLAAPHSGKETRKQIQSKSAEIRDLAERTVDDVLNTFRTTTYDASGWAEELEGGHWAEELETGRWAEELETGRWANEIS